MRKIKKLLGVCQAKGCWNRSTLIVEEKNINVKRHMCASCCDELFKLIRDDYFEVRKGGDK